MDLMENIKKEYNLEEIKEKLLIIENDHRHFGHYAIFEVGREIGDYIRHNNLRFEDVSNKIKISKIKLFNYVEGNEKITGEDYIKFSKTYNVDIIENMNKKMKNKGYDR